MSSETQSPTPKQTKTTSDGRVSMSAAALLSDERVRRTLKSVAGKVVRINPAKK